VSLLPSCRHIDAASEGVSIRDRRPASPGPSGSGQPELRPNAASAGTWTPASATGTSGSGDPQPRFNAASTGTLMPPSRTATPSSPSRMSFALNSTQQQRYVKGGQLAATKAQLPRPPQAQRSRRDRACISPSFLRTHASGSLPKGPSMRVLSGGAQGGGTLRDSERGRGVQLQAPPPLTAGQRRAARVPSGSGQPQAWTNAATVVDPRQHQSHSHPPDQQGLEPHQPHGLDRNAVLLRGRTTPSRASAATPEMRRLPYSRKPLVMHPRAGLHYCLCYFCLLAGGVGGAMCAICAFW
jgi:hypothetical protein